MLSEIRSPRFALSAPSESNSARGDNAKEDEVVELLRIGEIRAQHLALQHSDGYIRVDTHFEIQNITFSLLSEGWGGNRGRGGG